MLDVRCWMFSRSPVVSSLWSLVPCAFCFCQIVALGGFARIFEVRGSRFRVPRWMLDVGCWMLDVISVNLCLSVVALGLYRFSQSSRNSPRATTC
jgi:hypothetical protein